MAESDVKAAIGSSLYAIQLGTILWVAAAATLALLVSRNLLAQLADFLLASSLASGASIAIAGLVLVFGLYIVWSTRRNLMSRLHATIEQARRTQVESTLEKAALRPRSLP